MTALVLGFIYGLGGLVHLGNILGYGEVQWDTSPLSWKLGDIWWGSLDVVAMIGVIAKSSIGIWALGLAAATQIVAYTAIPEAFAVTDGHHRTLEGLVYFNGAALAVLGSCLFAASRKGV